MTLFTGDYLEYYLTLVSWLIHNGIWMVLVASGVFALPFLAIVLQEWLKARAEGADEGNKGVLSAARIENRVFVDDARGQAREVAAPVVHRPGTLARLQVATHPQRVDQLEHVVELEQQPAVLHGQRAGHLDVVGGGVRVARVVLELVGRDELVELGDLGVDGRLAVLDQLADVFPGFVDRGLLANDLQDHLDREEAVHGAREGAFADPLRLRGGQLDGLAHHGAGMAVHVHRGAGQIHHLPFRAEGDACALRNGLGRGLRQVGHGSCPVVVSASLTLLQGRTGPRRR